MLKHTPKTLEELRSLRTPIRNTNIDVRRQLRTLDRLALWTTENVGTMGFFLIVLAWTILWLFWNILAPIELRFDPYPAFALWLFISNMVQILLMPLILVGQNLQSAHSEARAQADFEVNVKAEREIETILEHLENQNDLLVKMSENAGK